MTEVIFSFDTENFTSNRGAAGIFREAEILRKAGVRGCFVITALLAKQFINWKRDDVLEALKHHEIGLHTYGHSLHPIIDEYTDIESFDDALSELLRQEGEAVEIVKSVLGVDKLYAAVPPGSTRSYVSMYGYAELGFSLYAGTSCGPEDGTINNYCNVNQNYYTYGLELDSFFGEYCCDKSAMLDEMAEKKRVVLYTHPDMSLYSKHWDTVNYKGGNKHPFGEWEEAPRRTDTESENFFRNFADLVEKVKNDSRFKITTYKELAERLEKEGERKIILADIPVLREQLNKNFYPVKSPASFSLSDMFLACRELLLGKDSHICGKVYGFLEEPYAITDEVTLRADSIVKSAEKIDVSGFLPTEIYVDSIKIGPADWLRGSMAVLCGETEVTLKPDANMPNLDIIPYVRDKKYEYKWMHGPDFEDKYLSERLYLQAWTMRFPNIDE